MKKIPCHVISFWFYSENRILNMSLLDCGMLDIFLCDAFFNKAILVKDWLLLTSLMLVLWNTQQYKYFCLVQTFYILSWCSWNGFLLHDRIELFCVCVVYFLIWYYAFVFLGSAQFIKRKAETSVAGPGKGITNILGFIPSWFS